LTLPAASQPKPLPALFESKTKAGMRMLNYIHFHKDRRILALRRRVPPNEAGGNCYWKGILEKLPSWKKTLEIP